MLRGRLVDIVGAVALVLLLILDWQFAISIWAYVILAALYILIIGFGSANISSQFFIPVRCDGDSQSGSIAITFDDGPLSGKTDRILDILKEHRVPATFFCIGERAQREPALLRRIHDEGHLIGNHSYFHGKLFDLQSSAKMTNELTSTDQVIEKSIGKKPRFFRPPYGVTNPMLARAVRKRGYITVGWNVRSMDSVIKEKENLLQRVTGELKAGNLILFHDYAEHTINALPEFLEIVKKKGLKIVRLDSFLHEQPYE